MSDRVDLEFFFDPMCPFAWITSRWVTEVAQIEDYGVRWRFISLALVNEDTDYAKFPPRYPVLHGYGQGLLRVAAAARDAHGEEPVGALYTAYGTRVHEGGVSFRIWDGEDPPAELVGEALAEAGLPASLAAAADDASWDAVLREETETALGRTGRDVGTPILTFDPGQPTENSLFGPVISKAPRGQEAVRLWEAVRTLAAVPSFAELKRSMRDPLDFT